MELSSRMMGRVAAALSLLASTTAIAEESSKFGYSLSLSATSDYMFRGISYNNEDPAFQPYLEFTYGIAYFALGGTNIAAPYGPFEFDLYAGIRPTTGPVNWDFAVLYYQYPGAKLAEKFDYVQFKGAASISPVQNLTTSLTTYYTPDQDIAYVESFTLEGNAAYTLPKMLMFTPTVSGLIGYTHSPEENAFFFGENEYTYWNAGVKLEVEKFWMDFRYWDTNIPTNSFNGGGLSLVDARFVFSAGVTLP